MILACNISNLSEILLTEAARDILGNFEILLVVLFLLIEYFIYVWFSTGEDVLQKRQWRPCGSNGPDYCTGIDVPCGGGSGMCPPGLKCCRHYVNEISLLFPSNCFFF